MFKKLFVLILVAGAVAIACLPWWTTRLAEQAFAQPEAPVADEMLHKAIRIKVLMLSHADAGKLAEKGTIYFPESPHLPTFLFIAAKSAEKAGNAEGAVHWYRRFLAAYPQHEWASQASGYLEKIKGMHDIE